ncbi:uncharacterized protein IUM83_13799 [Phytophthora cinnamomi]|uniref:uncharacterized protein n=1 Tax=Phytophthora cinnamomi TaxID=4785 RepID=UPI003559B197|nr:hypothetical protein IUM83_13799 [Phytophthora cinnamomi]
MRLTKQQQLDLCAMRTREPTWSLATLGEWAREMFALDKAPGKSSVKMILDNESSLKRPRCDRVDQAACTARLRRRGSLETVLRAGPLCNRDIGRSHVVQQRV